LILFLLLTDVGGSGHIQFYSFDKSKEIINADFVSVINAADSICDVSEEYNDENTLRDGWIKDIYVFFSSEPKEVYRLGFAYYNEEWDDKFSCDLALIGVFDGVYWYFNRDMKLKEKKRITERLERDILSKMYHSYSKK